MYIYICITAYMYVGICMYVIIYAHACAHAHAHARTQTPHHDSPYISRALIFERRMRRYSSAGDMAASFLRMFVIRLSTCILILSGKVPPLGATYFFWERESPDASVSKSVAEDPAAKAIISPIYSNSKSTAVSYGERLVGS